MSALTNVIPAEYRKYLYAFYALVGLVLGSIQIAYGVTEPSWVTVALAVYGYVGGAFGATAASNISAPQHRAE